MASLTNTNKHLSTASKREKAVRLTIATSSAIEGIHVPFKRAGVVAQQAASKAKAAPPTGVRPAQRAKSAG